MIEGARGIPILVFAANRIAPDIATQGVSYVHSTEVGRAAAKTLLLRFRRINSPEPQAVTAHIEGVTVDDVNTTFIDSAAFGGGSLTCDQGSKSKDKGEATHQRSWTI